MNRIQKQKIQLVMTCTSLNDHIASWWYVLICQKKKKLRPELARMHLCFHIVFCCTLDFSIEILCINTVHAAG